MATDVKDANVMTGWSPEDDEGPRFPATLQNEATGEVFEVVDVPIEEKHKIAFDASQRRAEEYAETEYRAAEIKLQHMNVVESIDYIQSKPPGDVQIYLRAEKAGQNRKEIFKVFGQPEEE